VDAKGEGALLRPLSLGILLPTVGAQIHPVKGKSPNGLLPSRVHFSSQTPTEYNRLSSTSRASNGPQDNPNWKRQGDTPSMMICSAMTPLG
jgi:hypothetical protein